MGALMVQPVYEWIKGSTFSLALDVLDGTVDGSTPITSTLKTPVNGKPPGSAAPALVTFAVSFVSANGDEPDHWLITGTDGQSDSLTVGDYVVDAVIEYGGGIVRTPAVFVKVIEGVT